MGWFSSEEMDLGRIAFDQMAIKCFAFKQGFSEAFTSRRSVPRQVEVSDERSLVT